MFFFVMYVISFKFLSHFSILFRISVFVNFLAGYKLKKLMATRSVKFNIFYSRKGPGDNIKNF